LINSTINENVSRDGTGVRINCLRSGTIFIFIYSKMGMGLISSARDLIVIRHFTRDGVGRYLSYNSKTDSIQRYYSPPAAHLPPPPITHPDRAGHSPTQRGVAGPCRAVPGRAFTSPDSGAGGTAD
jgi:hypothetical protein